MSTYDYDDVMPEHVHLLVLPASTLSIRPQPSVTYAAGLWIGIGRVLDIMGKEFKARIFQESPSLIRLGFIARVFKKQVANG